MVTNPRVILSIDCDLQQSYGALRVDDKVVMYQKAPSPAEVLDCMSREHPRIADGMGLPQVLMEVGSAVDYDSNDGETRGGAEARAYHKRRWLIWNTAMALALDDYCKRRRGCKLLVAPSSAWTRGYKPAVRQAIACCKGPCHDTREAEAMGYFYLTDPAPWVSVDAWLAGIKAPRLAAAQRRAAGSTAAAPPARVRRRTPPGSERP
jgi:hypothetical protein